MHKSVVLPFLFILLIYSITLAGTGVGESSSGFLTSLPPNAPDLISPVDETTDVSDSTMVVWHATPYTFNYALQVSYTTDFTGFILTQNDIEDTSFTLSVLAANTSYYWRVNAVNAAGAGEFSPVWHFSTAPLSAITEKANQVPQRYVLLPAYPNPFNPEVNLTYKIPEQQKISLMIYNSMGQIVRVLVTGMRQPGTYTEHWNGKNDEGFPVTSGIYMFRLVAGNRVFTQKLLLMR